MQHAAISPHLPPTYTQMVLVKLRKRGQMLLKSGKRITAAYVHDVRKGTRVDFPVLDALREVAMEAGTLQPAAQQ